MTKFLRGLNGLLKAFLRGCLLVLKWIWKVLNIAWNWVQCIAQILMPLRFSVLTIFLVALLFLWSAPGKDLLLSLADQEILLTSKIILFFVALFFWSMCLWYWSRVMMRFIHDNFFDSQSDTEEEKEWKIGLLDWFRKHIPRLMGLVPFIVMVFAFLAAGKVYSDQPSDILQTNLNFLCLISVGLGALYYFIVVNRGRMVFEGKDPQQVKKHYAPHHKNWDDLGRTSFTVLFATLGLSTRIFIVVWVNPQAATLLGTGSVLFLASASWVAFGSTMVSLGKGFKFPIISAALIGAVIIGPCTDNHQVRTLSAVTPETSQLTWDQRPTVNDDFEEWLATRSEIFSKEAEFDEEKIHPIFIIAAEGGGIRAAYWTANLLAAFQDTNPNFADHVYALSGISGGSLGTALFINLLKHQNDLDCSDSGIDGENKARLILKKHNQHNIQQCDWIVKRDDGSYFIVEVKNKKLFEPEPFWGTGTDIAQIKLRTQLLSDKGMDTLFMQFIPDNPGIYFTGWLSKLEKTEYFDTSGQVRIYDIRHFKKYDWED